MKADVVQYLLILGVFMALNNVARAEHYLSVDEAQRVCFPEADRFEARTVRLSAEQSKAVEQKSGVRVRNREVEMRLARKGGDLAGVLVVDHVFGKHDLIDYVVAIAPDGKVRQVEILEYREHYGGEIRDPKWRGQFAGRTAASNLKLNDDVYNISGATISCRNVTEGVRRVLATFELGVRPQLSAAGRVPDAPGARP